MAFVHSSSASGAVMQNISSVSVFGMPKMLTLNQCLESLSWTLLSLKTRFQHQHLRENLRGDVFWLGNLAKFELFFFQRGMVRLLWKGIRLGWLPSWLGSFFKVEAAYGFRSPSLLLSQLLYLHEDLQIMVVGVDNELQPVRINFRSVSPFLETSKNSQKFIVQTLIILFCPSTWLGQVFHRLEFTILLKTLGPQGPLHWFRNFSIGIKAKAFFSVTQTPHWTPCSTTTGCPHLSSGELVGWLASSDGWTIDRNWRIQSNVEVCWSSWVSSSWQQVLTWLSPFVSCCWRCSNTGIWLWTSKISQSSDFSHRLFFFKHLRIIS